MNQPDIRSFSPPALSLCSSVSVIIVSLGGLTCTAGGSGLLTAAVVIFVLAALGGLTLFSFHLRGRELPKPLILAQGGIAVTGFIVLVFAFLAQ